MNIGINNEIISSGITYDDYKNNSIQIWNPWSIYVKENWLEIFKQFEGLLKSIHIDADYVCVLPTSGYPLIPIASSSTNLPILTYRKQPSKIPITFDNSSVKKGSKIFLVDTNINLGESIDDFIIYCKKNSFKVVGFAVIIYNNTLYEYYPVSVKTLFEKGDAHYLYKLSDFI